MIIGMDRIFATSCAIYRFVGDTGYHFVDVHVRLGARPGLPDGQRKLIIIFAGPHRIGCFFDGGGNLRIQPVDAIDPRRRLFDRSEAVDQPDRHAFLAGKWKILDAALGLCAPIGVGGDFYLAE